MQKITPFLWFNDNAEEAVDFYVSLFPSSRVVDVSRFGEGGPGPAGSLMSATFELHGQRFMALNGGPHYTISPGISFFVNCESQQEVDALWDRLLDGGEPTQCGWITDRFGVTWQIIPRQLGEMLGDPDPQRSQRVLAAMMQMVKIDVAELQRAYDAE
jgi:predicted 3-demethylubiquinone-9 3-methyltransferase (glyoxalase superfamily)